MGHFEKTEILKGNYLKVKNWESWLLLFSLPTSCVFLVLRPQKHNHQDSGIQLLTSPMLTAQFSRTIWIWAFIVMPQVSNIHSMHNIQFQPVTNTDVLSTGNKWMWNLHLSIRKTEGKGRYLVTKFQYVQQWTKRKTSTIQVSMMIT